MAKIIYSTHRFRRQTEKIKQVHTGQVKQYDSEGFPAGYLYLELKQPHFLDLKS